MVDDDLSDIEINLEPLDIHGWTSEKFAIAMGIVPIGMIYLGISAFVERGDTPMLVTCLVVSVPLLWLLIRSWQRRPNLLINGREARLTGCKEGDWVIRFGPHVLVDIAMDPGERKEDGWGGFYGMTLEEGDKKIHIRFPWPFKEREVKAVWPDFVRLVRAHGMRRGPVLAKVLEMADTGEGQMVLDPRLKWRILDSPSP